MGENCPFLQDCRLTKEKVQALEVSHATMAAQVEAVAGCATRIEQSVGKALDAFNDTTKDLYSKYGAVKADIHTEETSRMKADSHIEEKLVSGDQAIEKQIEEKTESRIGKIITWGLAVIAIVVSVFAVLR